MSTLSMKLYDRQLIVFDGTSVAKMIPIQGAKHSDLNSRKVVLTIAGQVPLYYHKQLTQTLILEEEIPEINFTVNEIVVN